MTEDETFRRLRRNPNGADVDAAVEKAMLKAANEAREKVLEEHGWTDEEYRGYLESTFKPITAAKLNIGSIVASRISASKIAADMIADKGVK